MGTASDMNFYGLNVFPSSIQQYLSTKALNPTSRKSLSGDCMLALR